MLGMVGKIHWVWWVNSTRQGGEDLLGKVGKIYKVWWVGG